jgi:hypothetical protein
MSASRAFLASRPPLILVLIAAVAGLVAPEPAGADGITRTYIVWNNPASGSYFEASNWSPANVPDEYGEVPVLPNFSGPYAVTLDQDVLVYGLEMSAHATLHVDGATIQTDGVPTTWGTFRIDHGGTVLVNRPLLINHGTIASGEGGGSLLIEMTSGVLGGINNQYGGAIPIDGGDLTIRSANILDGQLLRNGGSYALRVDVSQMQGLVVTSNAEIIVDGDLSLMSNGVTLYNYGTVRVRGRVHFGVTTQYTDDGDGEFVLEGGNLNTGYVDGDIVNAAAHTIRGCGSITGSLVNHGTVDLDCPDAVMVGGPQLTNDGTLRIHSGTMRVDNYTQLPGGALEMGLASPTQFSRLEVTGSAVLDGAIEATPIGGFMPAPGDQFDVLSYASVSGAFSEVVPLEGLDVTPVYGADELSLSVSQVAGIDPHVPAALRLAGRGIGSGACFVLDLPRDAMLDVRAYDVRGREVARLANGMRPAGVHTFPVGAELGLPSGVYFARAEVRRVGTVETLSARVAMTR